MISNAGSETNQPSQCFPQLVSDIHVAGPDVDKVVEDLVVLRHPHHLVFPLVMLEGLDGPCHGHGIFQRIFFELFNS